MGDVIWLLLRAVVALGCVLGLIWWGARRLTAGRTVRSGSEAHIMVVDRHTLARGSGVAVLAVGSRRLLVGFGDQQVSLLTELAPVIAPVLPAPGGEPPGPAGRQRAGPDTRPRRSRLEGSILHPQTWKDTMRALQDKTVRR
ncbi:MAG: flagellar biosynthetic protein FliO [Micrococcales bacterium]|nr:flagellar biosynthetic protein FliO [Micrococcales bacterium]